MRRARHPARGVFLVLLLALIGVAVAGVSLRGPKPARGATPSGADKPAASAAPAAPPSAGATAQALPGAPSTVPAAPPKPGTGKERDVEDRTTLPVGKGLPLGVRVGVFYLDVKSFEDAKGEYEATTDVRLRWSDSRLSFDARDEYRGFKELRFGEADRQLKGMWSPQVDVANRLGDPSFTMRRLRIYPDGEVELITRTTARYEMAVDPERFPFDRQHLLLDLIVRENSTDEVELEIHHEDVEYSRPAQSLVLPGWTPGIVDLDPEEVPGWNGDRYSRVRAALDMDRDPKGALAPIFIPLIASLLIPLLSIWMNKATEEGFEVDAFELANVVIGGLFSVIALSFAIYSAYGVLAGNDNTVTRLFALNYVSLALSLGVVVLLFRMNLPRRLWGPHVHQEVFRFVLWALPVLSASTSVAFILAARA